MMDKKRRTHVYVLKDPITGEIKYVGKTINPEKRIKEHIGEAVKSAQKISWILSLLNQGVEPIIEIIASEDGDGSQLEKKYIREYISQGMQLLNIQNNEKNQGSRIGRKRRPHTRPNRKKGPGSEYAVSKATEAAHEKYIERYESYANREEWFNGVTTEDMYAAGIKSQSTITKIRKFLVSRGWICEYKYHKKSYRKP